MPSNEEGHVPTPRDGDREDREATSGQEALRAAHRAELERLAAEVGAAEDIGREKVVEIVQAYHEVEAGEVLQLLRTAEGLERATWDPRQEVARDTVVQDVELPTGERFRLMVQRLR